MEETLTPKKVQKRIEAAAVESRAELRHLKSIAVGKAIRQGDIYVRRLARVPRHIKRETGERQLAPGTTRGSRHRAEGPVKVYLPAENEDALQGPVLEASGRFRITHPEHADFSLPAGVYRVTYQRDFSREGTEFEDELWRVED